MSSKLSGSWSRIGRGRRAALGAGAALLLSLAAVLAASTGGFAAHEPKATWRPGDSALRLGPALSWLAEDRKLSAAEALAAYRAGDFTPSESRVPNFGYVDRPHWFAVDVEILAAAPVELLLDVAYPLLDSLEVHRFRDGQTLDSRSAGDIRPFRERETDVKDFAFRYLLEGGTQTFLFRVETGGSMCLPASLVDPGEFASRSRLEYGVSGIYVGVILIMALFNLFLWATTRERVNLLYAAYVLSYLTVIASLNGLTFQYLWPDSPAWANRAVPLLIFAEVVLMVLFAGEFLGLRGAFPGLRVFFAVLAALAAAGAVASVFADYARVIRLSAAYGVATIAAILGAGFYAVAGASRSSRYYIFGWGILLVGIMLYGLQNLGLLPFTFATRYTQQIGSVFEVALLTLALAERSAEERRSSESAQRELLAERTRALHEQVRLTAEAESRLRITEVYTRHTLVELIRRGEDPTSFPPRDERCAVLFADIRGFTTLSEDRGPLGVVGLLNSYFDRMNARIIAEGGEIDKLIGDCVMALFRDPDAAVRASVAMRADLDALNDSWDFHGRRRIDNGVGITWGQVILGNIGSRGKMDYTVVGDVVNSASRLEELTKHYRTPILVSGELVAAAAGRYRSRFLDLVQVKGKSEPTEIHEIYDHEPERVAAVKDRLGPRMAAAYAAYREGSFEEAGRMYGSLARDAGPHSWLEGICLDPAIDYFRGRCAALAERRRLGLLGEWRGVFEFSGK